MSNKFAVFILTHGRPDKVITYKTLRRCGYTGDIYIIVDNEDKTIDRYREVYGDMVIVFDKAAIAKTFDEAGVFEDRRAVVYARNASFEIARDLGLDYFLQLDDDYQGFDYRISASYDYRQAPVQNLDTLFTVLFDFYKDTPFLSIAMAQSGDYIGGILGGAGSKVWLKRKAMNTFFCAVDRPFQFLGRVNEDVNTYVSVGNRGGLFGTIMQCSITQHSTQQQPGGMTELYLESGTYIKSFYTVMFAPQCVTIQELGPIFRRLHHKINWQAAIPQIISEKHAPKPSIVE